MSLRRQSAVLVLCFVMSAVLTRLSFGLLDDPVTGTSVWWPLAGAGLAVLARLRRTDWPSALVGIASGQLAGGLLFGSALEAALEVTVTGSVELLAVSLVLRRVFPDGVHLESPRHAARFTGGVVEAVALSSVAYGLFQSIQGDVDLLAMWSGYFRSHALGMLLVSPVFLISTRGRLRAALDERRANLEWLAQILAVVVVGAAVFAVDQRALPTLVCALPLLWGGLRLGPLRSMISLLLLGLIATIGTLHSLGPFGSQPGTGRIYSIQAALTSLCLLLLFIVLTAQARDQALRASEDRAAALLKAEEITGTGSAVLDVATGTVSWTLGLYRQLGLDPATETPAVEKYFAAVHPDDRSWVAASVKAISVTGQTRVPLEYRLLRPDGTERLILGRTEPELGEDGRVVRLHSTIQDITALREAELARNRADTELNAILGALTETAIVTTSAESGLITRFNAGAERLLGFRAEEVIGLLQPSDFHTAERRDAAMAGTGLEDPMRALLEETQKLGPFTEQITAVRKDGSQFPAQLSLTPYTTPDGSLEFIGVLIDLTEVLQAQADLEDSEDRFSLAFDGAPLAMLILSLDAADPGVILRANAAMCSFAQKSWPELRGTHLLDLIEEPSASKARHTLALLVSGEKDRSSSDRRFHTSGSGELWGRMSTAAVRPADGRAPYLIVMIEDITTRRELTERFRHEASHDALTGLPNRSQLRRSLDTALSESERTGKVAVLYIDLDGFKAVNDAQGHGAGDELLIQVADRIASCVRASDVVARLGGDEFAVLCPGVADADTAITIGHDIIATLAEQFELDHTYARIGASVGVALSGPRVESGSALLQAADEAMYQAKRDGKGRVRVSLT